MKPPFSLVPALPVAAGLASGIACAATQAGAVALCIAAGAALAAGLWLWRRARWFASAPLAFAIGIALYACGDRRTPAEPLPARSVLAEAIYTSPMQGDAAAFAAATLVADRQYVTTQLRDSLRGSGLAHLMALSGFHVGIVAALAMWLTAPAALLRRMQAARALAAMCIVWIFVAVGGMGAPLVRAAVMFSLLLAGRLAGRYVSPFNSLCVAAVAILAVSPGALFELGFRLSFAAVAGIIAFADTLNPVDRARRPHLWRLTAMLAVPVGATLATAPVVAHTFGTVPLLFLPANMVTAVVFAPFYMVSLAVALLGAAGVEAVWLARCADALYAVIARTTEACCAPVQVHTGPATLTALALAVVALAFVLGQLKKTAATPPCGT
ncbi:MAG: ComEC/Rec2 family competence protein [Muribaculaceae bacterium]|nr:ComEC/Rec2 family competence protein [Muribaculaceae bacterium]